MQDQRGRPSLAIGLKGDLRIHNLQKVISCVLWKHLELRLASRLYESWLPSRVKVMIKSGAVRSPDNTSASPQLACWGKRLNSRRLLVTCDDKDHFLEMLVFVEPSCTRPRRHSQGVTVVRIVNRPKIAATKLNQPGTFSAYRCITSPRKCSSPTLWTAFKFTSHCASPAAIVSELFGTYGPFSPMF